MNKKVLLGMSGGVDSSVAAYLLKSQGYEVVGLHFTLESGKADASDVVSVAEKLGIQLHFADFSKEFESGVLAPFVAAYACGKTPNICVECNKKIKFGLMREYAYALGCDYVATGHYCAITNVYGNFYLTKPVDKEKDQTYFLHGLNEAVLSKTLFPLSRLTKPEVRAIAEREGLITAHKKGSSDICIMGDRSFSEFIGGYLGENEGEIVDDKGNVVGRHKGIFNYTLGQRKGLDLGGRSGEDGRWFVIGKDAAKNRLIVSHGDESALFTDKVLVKDFNFINGTPSANRFDCLAKTRYRQTAAEATVIVCSDVVEVRFKERIRAATAGQYCVLYDGDVCIGGGEII